MPITISLLNSFSGVAAAIAGLAISDVLLVSIGGIVGASGLLLTQIMCKAMNRKLFDILLSKTTQKKSVIITQKVEMLAVPKKETSIETSVVDVIKQAKSVIIVPGYGMAVAQAQHLVKKLADFMRSNGTTIKYAIHPVAGRMPGHMNVLLCEANVDYEDLYEMDDINNEFKSTDLTIVIGANDVMNPAARNAVGTPIYGMPILDVDDCKQVIIFNYDLKPGYAGVENPIYQRTKNIYLELGNASDTIAKILSEINNPTSPEEKVQIQTSVVDVIKQAKSVIIVPGYGMAVAQAQHLVKKLADFMRSNGTTIKYAIHPVAGRMPGHMNVLLCEANVDYEDLYEMDDINNEFKSTDLTIVIGANDVMNPAARNAVGTPIYGMPILDVDDCKQVIIFNYDLKPGYAGVENPIYQRTKNIYLELGNASDTIAGKYYLKSIIQHLLKKVQIQTSVVDVIKQAKSVIIVPGYGMAVAQAQHLVKKLADFMRSNGTSIKYAIHPVAGRMPGHMNVLLCEANVDYEDLYEMDDINNEFKSTDLTIVIGANDVMNPAARNAVGTPIYGMPILDVDDCKQVIIFNYDLKPGYAGVENPIYQRTKNIYLELGNASDTIAKVLEKL